MAKNFKLSSVYLARWKYRTPFYTFSRSLEKDFQRSNNLKILSLSHSEANTKWLFIPFLDIIII